MSKEDPKKIHHNWPQVMVNLVQTQIMVCLWGRATGKTEGPIADFIFTNVRLMPRSLGAIVSVTYEKMLRFIIPKLVKAWERYGYLENKHYWVRKKAPDRLKRELPFLPVTDSKHFIHHWNGAGNTLISMDRPGIGNAGDLDYIAGDEMRFIKKENLDEVLNANRGNGEHFGHLSQHHSVLLTSDMPQDMKGRWLLDFAELVDPDIIEKIIQIQQRIFELQDKLENLRSEASKQKVQRLINKYMADLNVLRREEVYVSEASTFDNIHALGISYLKNLKRTLSNFIWQLSILNEKVAAVENGFYPLFDEDTHGYTASNDAYIDSLNINFHDDVPKDCRWDKDCDNDLPLHIALDHNKAITWLVVFQDKTIRGKRVIQLQNCFYVKDPKRIRHVVNMYNEYYASRENRTVYYWYDHNSVAEDSMKEQSFADEVFKRLNQGEFQVIKKYIGRAPSHKAKFELWHEMMEGKNPRLPAFQINTINCETLITAIKQTDTKLGKNGGFEKNKDKEKDKTFPQEEAPHGTDAMDMPVFGLYASKLKQETHHGGAIT